MSAPKKQKTNPIKFKLQDSDEILEYDEQIARGSRLISDLLEMGKPSEAIALPIKFEVFKKAMLYCEIHKGNKMEADKQLDQLTELSAQDRELLKNLEPEFLFDLVKAANYLAIEGLLDLACHVIAILIEGNSADKIRKIFKIENDLSKDEIETFESRR